MELLNVRDNAKAIHDLSLINYHPYPYAKEAVATETLKWLSWTQWDKQDRVKLLQAFMRAVLLQCSEVQKFLELVGYGKTGKTTFANICTALVGHENMVSTNFKEMESNKFELTNFVGKKLILLPDQGKYGGGVDNLKALCGGDSLRAEVKGKQETKMFQFRGMMIITANQEMQSTDKTSGLSRRRITIYFNRVFQGAPSEQKILMSFDIQNNPVGVFAKELPGLINWILSMPEDEMKNYLMDTKNYVEGFKEEESKRDRKVSTLHDWLGEHVIYDPNYWMPIGIAKENRNTQDGNHRFCNFGTHLYPSYLEHCLSIMQNKCSRGNFLDGLEEFCRINNLEVSKEDSKRVKGYRGLRLRNESSIVEQNEWPSILDYVNNKKDFKHIYEK
jgi:putative DNA primase/helicase